jgi:hypothetical protein
MHKIGLLGFVMILTLSIPSIAVSQTQEIKEYQVVRGDTLWDISAKELNDPFLWPKIWKENPEITNPDFLLPGQIIRIPLYVLHEQKEEPLAPALPPQPKKEMEVSVKKGPAPVKLEPLVNEDLFIGSGYISDRVTSIGVIDGSPSGKNLFGNGDTVYVKTDNPVQIGDKFYIIRAGNIARHPVTNDVLGYIIEIVGVAEIADFEYGETKATITDMFNAVQSGDLLSPYYEMTPPLTTGVYRKPDITGYVVAGRSQRVLNGNMDVVYVDMGASDGVAIGDIFRTVAIGEHKVPNGEIQIINTRDTTATAVIVKNTDPVMPGNMFTRLK